MADLQVTSQREQDVGILHVNGEVRLEIGESLHAAGQGLLSDGVRNLLVDLGGVTFMDSASLGVLIRLAQEVEVDDGRIVLYDLSRIVRRLLDHAGLGERFVVAVDEAAARALLS
jgi:anti-anti-sigma factor